MHEDEEEELGRGMGAGRGNLVEASTFFEDNQEPKWRNRRGKPREHTRAPGGGDR